jgi:hypothetical protein
MFFTSCNPTFERFAVSATTSCAAFFFDGCHCLLVSFAVGIPVLRFFRCVDSGVVFRRHLHHPVFVWTAIDESLLHVPLELLLIFFLLILNNH